jgi:hypothetical protein
VPLLEQEFSPASCVVLFAEALEAKTTRLLKHYLRYSKSLNFSIYLELNLVYLNMKINFTESYYHIGKLIKYQLSLLISLFLIVSPITTFLYNEYNSYYYFFEPLIAIISLFLFSVFIKIQYKISKIYGVYFPPIIKILQVLSLAIMLIFNFLDLFYGRSIIMMEIELVYFTIIPIEVYLVISNRNRILSGLNNKKNKSLSFNSLIILFSFCFFFSLLYTGINNHTLLLIGLSLILSVQFFFSILIFIEFFFLKFID